MASYVITGVSRGLGWEFLRQLSADENNKVIGLVRDKVGTEKRVAEELAGRTNITILQADITNYNTLKDAASATAEVTGGSVDYLIANAGSVSKYDAFDDIGTLTDDLEEFNAQFQLTMNTNVLGNIHLFKVFLPLVLKSSVKKVIHITSAHADLDPIRQFDVEPASVYSISKAGMNIAVAKFSAQYRRDGVLFMSISPGVVDVGGMDNITPAQWEKLGSLLHKFKEFAPHFEGQATPEDSIKDMLTTIRRASIEDGFGGAFVSHKGDKQWL